MQGNQPSQRMSSYLLCPHPAPQVQQAVHTHHRPFLEACRGIRGLDEAVTQLRAYVQVGLLHSKPVKGS